MEASRRFLVCPPFLRFLGKYSESSTDIFETPLPLDLMLSKWNNVMWNITRLITT
jgi:hypothetical protein